MKTPLRHSAICAALALTLCGSARADDWDWIVTPYLWATTIGTDLERTIPPTGGTSADATFDDIIDKLDGAFLMHVEGQGDDFGVFADFIYLGLGDENDRERFRTESDLDARVFDLAGVWSMGDGRFQGFDLFGGLRYIDLDVTVLFDPVNPAFANSSYDSGQTFYDLLVGARYTAELSDRWGVTFSGDLSGGDTEGTWNTSATLSYRMQSGYWFLGYRYMAAEFEDRDSTTEITLNGPMFGYGFAF